ncbi:MAG: ATP synthase F0 subunit B [Acidobacteriota bacterium]|jgi:F0F1-type ATP synthase membrane subunit b/b'|nr:ATP synthase F0 subunit B [Acidobacteriota bacterium]
MNLRKTLFIIVFIMVSLTAWSAEPGGHGHGFDWFGFLGKVFNSTVLFGGLIYLLRKPLIRLVSDQSRSVRADIEDRRKSIQASDADYAALKKRLEGLEAEIREIRRQAEENGKRERSRIEADGRAEAERIARLTREEIGNRVDAAVRRLKDRVAEMAIQRFKEEIQGQLDAERHRRIMEKNIEISGEVIGRQ